MPGSTCNTSRRSTGGSTSKTQAGTRRGVVLPATRVPRGTHLLGPRPAPQGTRDGQRRTRVGSEYDPTDTAGHRSRCGSAGLWAAPLQEIPQHAASMTAGGVPRRCVFPYRPSGTTQTNSQGPRRPGLRPLRTARAGRRCQTVWVPKRRYAGFGRRRGPSCLWAGALQPIPHSNPPLLEWRRCSATSAPFDRDALRTSAAWAEPAPSPWPVRPRSTWNGGRAPCNPQSLSTAPFDLHGQVDGGC